MQLVHDLLINLHSNNHHLIRCCCHGNKTKNPRLPPMAAILDFSFLKVCFLYSNLASTDRDYYRNKTVSLVIIEVLAASRSEGSEEAKLF